MFKIDEGGDGNDDDLARKVIRLVPPRGNLTARLRLRLEPLGFNTGRHWKLPFPDPFPIRLSKKHRIK